MTEKEKNREINRLTKEIFQLLELRASILYQCLAKANGSEIKVGNNFDLAKQEIKKFYYGKD